jgi:hypothetical protein
MLQQIFDNIYGNSRDSNIDGNSIVSVEMEGEEKEA